MTRALFFLAGVALIVLGALLIYVPAGLIVAGAAVAAFVVVGVEDE